jgi:hypothetical protein
VLPYVKQQFRLTYTVSALMFVAVSSGYLLRLLLFMLFFTDIQLFRFIVATFTLERLTNYFGRFPLSSKHRLFFPPLHLSILSCLRYISTCIQNPDQHGWFAPKAMGFSLTQGRHFLLILAAFLQTCFFITISTSPTFAGVVAGFFMNGLAKAYMMCESSLARIRHNNLKMD